MNAVARAATVPLDSTRFRTLRLDVEGETA